MKAKFDPQASDGKEIGFCSQLQLCMAKRGAKIQSYQQKKVIFSQEDPAATLFYVRQGRIKLTIFSSEGKAATIAILNSGDFLGEECLVPCHSVRLASALAISDCSLLQIEKGEMLAALDSDRALARSFTRYLLTRKARAEELLADQLSHSSEKRLIRLLLLLGGSETSGQAKRNPPEITQEILAEMVGTTRPRISYFMTKFRKLGLVDYRGGLRVSKELQYVVR
jgi:CRP/FNR family transcriptional regulator, cyclic AMP receptor protein